MFRYRDRLWLSFRYHLMAESGRCQTAIVELDQATLQPIGASQRIVLTGPKGNEHHEDARLFTYLGEPYLSLTEMTGYKAGVDYSCQMRYAKLHLQGNRWKCLSVWTPNIGVNHQRAKEKNWIFFEDAGHLRVIYRDDPDHAVYLVNGEHGGEQHVTPAAKWPWGPIRGGTPPVRLDDGNLLVIFHSSVPSENPPHFVRYYAGAYVMQGVAPFRILKISRRPLMAGSEADGHKVDPRYVEGWKPYVVFPCGLVRLGEDLLISLGVNDWQCAVARVPLASLDLVAADGSDSSARYFTRRNGTVPVRVVDQDRQAQFLPWLVPRPGPGCSVGDGYMELTNPRMAEEVAESEHVQELTKAEYDRAIVPPRR